VNSLTHFDTDGRAVMVDVTAKPETDRIATAAARIVMQPATLAIIQAGTAKKGDVLGTARLAGIMAAKRTAELIPLCHPLPITSVTLDLEVDGQLSIGAAHVIATRLEETIRAEIGEDIEVETHIEPLETRELPGRDDDAEATTRFAQTLRRLAANDTGLVDIHHVRLRIAAGGRYGLFHCRIAPETSVDAVHAAVDALERAARREFPDLSRVIGHAEPLREPRRL